MIAALKVFLIFFRQNSHKDHYLIEKHYLQTSSNTCSLSINCPKILSAANTPLQKWLSWRKNFNSNSTSYFSSIRILQCYLSLAFMRYGFVPSTPSWSNLWDLRITKTFLRGNFETVPKKGTQSTCRTSPKVFLAMCQEPHAAFLGSPF